MKKTLALLALAVGLTGCHIDYNQRIECPSFSASDVYVYKFDFDTYIVVYPPSDPRAHTLINDSGCKVEHE